MLKCGCSSSRLVANANSPLQGTLGTKLREFLNSPRILPPVHNVGPKSAHFKDFWELATVNMGEIWLKIALNCLFEHSEWSGNNFGKTAFDPQ